MSDLQNIVSTLNNKGVSVHFLSENLVFTKEGDNPFAKLQLQLLGSLAEFERNIIKRRQRDVRFDKGYGQGPPGGCTYLYIHCATYEGFALES